MQTLRHSTSCRLSAKRGMGALEFEPELSRERRTTKIDMKSLAMLYLIIVIKVKGELLLQV